MARKVGIKYGGSKPPNKSAPPSAGKVNVAAKAVSSKAPLGTGKRAR